MLPHNPMLDDNMNIDLEDDRKLINAWILNWYKLMSVMNLEWWIDEN